MTTFADAGIEITNLFTKTFPEDKTLEVNFIPNPEHLSVSLLGKFVGNTYRGVIVPTFTYRPWGLRLKSEISSPDINDNTLLADLTVSDIITTGLEGSVGFMNGKKGEIAVGAVYRHVNFGGITAKLGFPIAAPKYLLTTLHVENPDTNGVGVGGSMRVSTGVEVIIDSWKAMLTYKTSLWNAFFGVEQKIDTDVVKKLPEAPGNEPEVIVPSNALYVVGGIMKKYETDKIFAINGQYNTTRDITTVEILFKKLFADGSFYKIKAGVDGNIHSARMYSVPHGSILIGGTANVISGTGAIGLTVTTNF